jgi:hypothetical protein
MEVREKSVSTPSLHSSPLRAKVKQMSKTRREALIVLKVSKVSLQDDKRFNEKK